MHESTHRVGEQDSLRVLSGHQLAAAVLQLDHLPKLSQLRAVVTLETAHVYSSRPHLISTSRLTPPGRVVSFSLASAGAVTDLPVRNHGDH